MEPQFNQCQMNYSHNANHELFCIIPRFAEYEFPQNRLLWQNQYGSVYQVFLTVKPENRIFLQVLQNQHKYDINQITKTLLNNLQDKALINIDEIIDLSQAAQVQILDRKKQKKFKRRCLIIKVVQIPIIHLKTEKKHEDEHVIHIGKFEFNPKNRIGISGLGEVYKGFQTSKPTNIVYIQVLSKPYQQVAQQEIQQLVSKLENMVFIEQNLTIGHSDGGEARFNQEKLKQWVGKKYMIIQFFDNYSKCSSSQVENITEECKIFNFDVLQFKLQQKLGKGSKGLFYQGFQTSKPTKSSYILVFDKLCQLLSDTQIENLVQELENLTFIDQKYTIGYQFKSELKIECDNSKGWMTKSCLLLNLLETPVLESSSSSQEQRTEFSEEQISQLRMTSLNNEVITVGKYQFIANKTQLLGKEGELVYRGHQTNKPLNKVAIKVVSSSLKSSRNLKICDLDNQISIIKSLNPNYAVQLLYEDQTQVYDKNFQQRVTSKCLVMELMDGSLQDLYTRQLKARLTENKKESINLVKHYYFKVICAYMACYQENIVHRNLNPSNILFKKNSFKNKKYQIKIAGFGHSTRKTSINNKQKVGALGYQSPQQAKKQKYTEKCDIFGLGGILIYLIFGRNPYYLNIISIEGKLNKQILYQKLKDYDDQRRSITKFLQKCFAYEQNERYEYYQLLTSQVFKQNNNKQGQAILQTDVAYIFSQKYIFKIDHKDSPLAKGSQGFFYNAFQVNSPRKKAYIMVLNEPYQRLTKKEQGNCVRELEEIQYIDTIYRIQQPMKGKTRIYDQDSRQWITKQCLIMQLVEVQVAKNSDQTKDQPGSCNFVEIGIYRFDPSSEPLGRGSQGIVYQGYQTAKPHNKVAVKVITKPYQKLTDKQIQRLNRQISIMKILDYECTVQLLHEGQVIIYDEKQNQNVEKKCLVLQLMDGSLADLYKNVIQPKMQESKKQGIKLVKKYYFRALRAYMGCYDKNIAHKDIKPENILIKKNKSIDGGYQIKIADFGIAVHQTIQPIKENVGTWGYWSPQQYNNMQYTNKCDMFAFGGILIFLILGGNPARFKIIETDSRVNQMMMNRLLGDYGDQDSSLIQFIKKCLMWNQEERFQWNQLFTHQFFEQVITPRQRVTFLNQISSIQRKKERLKTQQKAKMRCKQFANYPLINNELRKQIR